jgi:RimJ/RimL family protein N-acetyltransferase
VACRRDPLERDRGKVFDRVESERLVLRRFEDRDPVPLLAYRNDPEVARYQGWESVSEREAWGA